MDKPEDTHYTGTATDFLPEVKGGEQFAADYHPTGDVLFAPPDSLDAFLTERYCLYAESPDGVLRGDIHQLARLERIRNALPRRSRGDFLLFDLHQTRQSEHAGAAAAQVATS